MGFLGAIWAGWKRFAHRLGIINTHILLTITYGTLFAIIGLGLKIFRKDLLHSRHEPGQSLWHDAVSPGAEDDVLVQHRRQF